MMLYTLSVIVLLAIEIVSPSSQYPFSTHALVMGIPKFGVPCGGPYHNGVQLFGVYIRGCPLFS